jgi:hypothetical protein
MILEEPINRGGRRGRGGKAIGFCVHGLHQNAERLAGPHTDFLSVLCVLRVLCGSSLVVATTRYCARAALLAATFCVAAPAWADSAAQPVFDAHVHYNLDIGRPVSVERVFELWRQAGIRGVLLTSRPNDGTRELLEKAPAEFKTVAFARPYVVMADVKTWFRDPAIYAMIEQELARGIYAGIGEFHIFGRDADREEFGRFVQLAAQHKLWLHAHCDDYVIDRIFALIPGAVIGRIRVWAPRRHCGRTPSRYPNLTGAVPSQRHTVGGELSSEWRGPFTVPTASLLGSDTWVAALARRPGHRPATAAGLHSCRWRSLNGLPGNGARLFLGE